MKKIIHVDMDAFYASVEQHDRPELRGKPVIVGGRAEDRGVVATCSYEARKFGVHSAMATATALRLCPKAVLVYPHFDRYVFVSGQINQIFHEYTDKVEPLSLDEAYLDVTENKKNMPLAVKIAREIKAKIYQTTGLTASAGVSYNKFLAKTASGFHKPDGLTVIVPEEAPAFIAKLPIGSFYGVGKVTEKRMLDCGIKTGADLLERPLEELIDHFGKSGAYFYQLARGIDESPVEPYRERQSFGREITFAKDIGDLDGIRKVLYELAADVGDMLSGGGIGGRTVTLKIKYFDFKQITRSQTFDGPVTQAEDIYSASLKLLERTDAGKKKIRLAGISLSNFHEAPRPKKPEQLELPFKYY